ncbi:hypothetical protein Vafri_5682 [Volvox africanus]|nr:hypothetical protein Vafri_5682 [Volvox africanus]
MQPSRTSGLTAALSSGNESAEKSDGSEGAAAPANSPFLRGELDSRAEDIMGAAEVLLQELKSSSPDVQQASLDWASLAQEAGQVAVALEALGGDDSPTGEALQRQLRRLAAVGCELAGGSVLAQDESAVMTTPAMMNTKATVPEAAAVFLQEVNPRLQGHDGKGASLNGVGQQLDSNRSDAADSDAVGQMVETAVAATVATAVLVDADSIAQISATETGVPLVPANLQDAVVPPSAFLAVEVAASGGQLVPALVPQPSPSPSPRGPVEAHPWQRLAANIKGQLMGLGSLAVAMLTAVRAAVGLR